jgi:hypothetical protein
MSVKYGPQSVEPPRIRQRDTSASSVVKTFLH